MPLLKSSCNRCGHVWIKRIEGRAKFCPACNSPYYDRERVYPIGTINGARKVLPDDAKDRTGKMGAKIVFK